MSIEIIMGGCFKLGKKVGTGSFGEIFTGMNIETNEPVALKLESTKTKLPQLLYEARVLKYLAGEGIRRTNIRCTWDVLVWS
jgi:casein kinase 1 epsilon